MINNELEESKGSVRWHEVTWYSRILAIILFVIILPVLSFYVGMRFEEISSQKPVPQDTFRNLQDENGPQVGRVEGFGFTTDDAQVYWFRDPQGIGSQEDPSLLNVLEGVDPVTFEFVSPEFSLLGGYYDGYHYGGGVYVKDANGVYLLLIKESLQDVFPEALDMKRVEMADPASFSFISALKLGRDKDHLYYETVRVNEALPDSFEAISTTSLYKDAKQVYYRDTSNAKHGIYPLFGLDAGSFTVLAGGYAKDKNAVYCLYSNVEVLAEADPTSFRVLREGYVTTRDEVDAVEAVVGADDANVYFGCTLSQADASTFAFIEGPNTSLEYLPNYAKDATGVYFTGYNTASPLSFTRDISGFKILFDVDTGRETRYSKDSVNVYYGGVRIEVADPVSFRLLADDEKEPINDWVRTDAEDKNHKYSKGKVVK